MKAVTIDVTADNIARGTPRTACDCPVSIALKRALRATLVPVDGRRASVWFSHDQVVPARVELPKSAQDFISAFDARGLDPRRSDNPPAPFSFAVVI